jgi:hypothetical protein
MRGERANDGTVVQRYVPQGSRRVI